MERRLVGVRVRSLADIARVAASLATFGQIAYVIRFPGRRGVVYGLMAVLRDYYNLYGLPILYYYVDESGEAKSEHRYILVKVDDQGEHVELASSTRPGWVAIPIMDLAEAPPFAPEDI